MIDNSTEEIEEGSMKGEQVEEHEEGFESVREAEELSEETGVDTESGEGHRGVEGKGGEE